MPQRHQRKIQFSCDSWLRLFIAYGESNYFDAICKFFFFFFANICYANECGNNFRFNFVLHNLQSDDQCKLVVFLKTKFACHSLVGALDTNTCTARDPQTGHIFNLMPLSQYNHKIPFQNGSEFLINICKPTLYGFDEMCPPGSSVCMLDASEKDLKKK